jgi:hypothetical protein
MHPGMAALALRALSREFNPRGAAGRRTKARGMREQPKRLFDKIVTHAGKERSPKRLASDDERTRYRQAWPIQLKSPNYRNSI